MTRLCAHLTIRRATHACAALRLLVYAYARPDLSTSAMESALCPLADHLSCDVCKQSLADRVKQLIVQWSVVKVSPCRLSLFSCGRRPKVSTAANLFSARIYSGQFECERVKICTPASASPASASYVLVAPVTWRGVFPCRAALGPAGWRAALPSLPARSRHSTSTAPCVAVG